jgi:hypothetical protein
MAALSSEEHSENMRLAFVMDICMAFNTPKKTVDFQGLLARFLPFMKSDTTTTVLNFVLAVLVILGVVFALMSILRTRELRQLQTNLQIRAQISQANFMRVQALAADVVAYNATAKSPELAKILQAATTPPSVAK